MLEEITRLVSLQAIDRELNEVEISLATIAEKVGELRAEADKAQAELDLLTQEEQQAAKQRHQLEIELAEGEARLRNKRMRLNQVRNEKELQALGHEVETLKEGNQRLEAETLALMETAQPRASRIKELTEFVSLKSAEVVAAEKEIASQVEDLKISIRKQKLDRDMMAKDIDATLLQRYEMLFSRRNGIAVTEARSGTCNGCRMMLPPQLFNEIQRNNRIYYCPNCQRILYYEG